MELDEDEILSLHDKIADLETEVRAAQALQESLFNQILSYCCDYISNVPSEDDAANLFELSRRVQLQPKFEALRDAWNRSQTARAFTALLQPKFEALRDAWTRLRRSKPGATALPVPSQANPPAILTSNQGVQ